MKETLQAGLSYEFRYLVPESKTVPQLYPESQAFRQMPRVFATGFMVGLPEGVLPSGQGSMNLLPVFFADALSFLAFLCVGRFQAVAQGGGRLDMPQIGHPSFLHENVRHLPGYLRWAPKTRTLTLNPGSRLVSCGGRLLVILMNP